MLTLIFETLFFLGLGTMIYLVARALPRIGDDVASAPVANPLDRFLAKIPTERWDEISGRVLEKFLRRTRLVILRLDNFLGKSLERVKRVNGNGIAKGGGKPTLFSVKEENKEFEE